ncbi:hypothetical protein EDC01DRAFT_10993 [Geopyxis carbonaria]|nr:hypothetical protein EDC01DRAFT_10993 [Geopyxis carbonaria]
MLPASLTPSHIVPPASSSPSESSNPRPGRLRGFSYLRHYTHGHHHQSQQSSPPAAPTVVTAATVSTAPQSSKPPSPPPPPRQRRATSPLNNTASNSWIPTVSGVSGLSRVASTPAAELSTSTVHATNVSPGPGQQSLEDNLPARSIGEAISTDKSVGNQLNAAMGKSVTTQGVLSSVDQPAPSIRFTPHNNSQSGRESLQFAPIERTLHTRDERIRVGRFSDRDVSNPNAPVGFKSKVVSRRHCEFWCDNGQWYVKDVKSSSGTFLNHIRLSAPGLESRAYPLNDGDMLQLGIDFKGGAEQMFRCVKIRVELNRAWQKSLNSFNMSAHRRLRNLARTGNETDSRSTNSSECAICLLPVAPCQSLFVAPCSHVWHYKCIRPLIEKDYPSFLCPNCRAMADLDRDIEEDEFGDELWEVIPDNIIGVNGENTDTQSQETAAVATAGTVGVGEATTATTVVTAADAEIAGPSSNRSQLVSATSGPAPVPEAVPDPISEEPVQLEPEESQSVPDSTMAPRQSGSWRRRDLELVSFSQNPERSSQLSEGSNSSGSGNEHNQEGPMTPMNDAGPFVLDGGVGNDRDGRRKTLFMPLSLDS